MTAPMLNRGLDHVALHCYDLDATVRFYTEALGFRVAQEWSAPDAGVHRCVFLDAGDDRVIELFDAASTPPGGSPTGLVPRRRPTDEERADRAALVHFAIRTDDPVTLFQRAVAAGARPLMEPSVIETSGDVPMILHVGFVHGLDDEVIEFIDRPAVRH
ncbi:VOC family protein [Streptomyces qinglanensis]|uniref:Glyoxylase I family protein n=1 Tax=Streptomyces qinglanensis TaxID=943816 RepID=A0A1H9WFE5_9ACTN|nr:VOC family protein [Streptomyces qinglanensis]SES32652.1 glyoxylase I family protein [Streptomyces qinglanensis]